MKRHKIRFYLLLLLGALAACGEQEQYPSQQEQEIKFNYFLQEGDNLIPLNSTQSRGVDNDLSRDVYLYGWWNTVDVPTQIGVTSLEDGSRRFFDKTPIAANGSYTGERRYWIADGKTRHSFCAYSGPAYVTPASGLFGVQHALAPNLGDLSKAAFYPMIDFHQHNDPAEQFDCLVAYGPTNVVVSQVTPVVNIHLRHACARIRLKLMVSGGVTLYDCSLKFTYPTSQVSSNSAIYYAPKFSQKYSNYHKGTYTLNSGMLIPASASAEKSAVLVGDLMLVPQPLPTRWLDVEVSYKLAIGGVVKTVKVQLPELRIDPDQQYTYYLTVLDQSESLTISDIELEPWTTERKLIDPL